MKTITKVWEDAVVAANVCKKSSGGRNERRIKCV